MFERIVAAIDDDAFRRKRVLEATRELAAARQSTVTVAHILEVERVAATGRPTTIATPPRLEDEALARGLVEEALTMLREAGVSAKGVVRSGGGSSTAKELLSLAGEFDADLIVVGDRGAHLSDLLLGGVAYRIVHAARCPVLLVR